MPYEDNQYPPTLQQPTSKTQTIETSVTPSGGCSYKLSKPVEGDRACLISGTKLKDLQLASDPEKANQEATSTSYADSVPVRIKFPKGELGKEITLPAHGSHCNAVATVFKNITCAGLAPCGDNLPPGACSCEGRKLVCQKCTDGSAYKPQTISDEEIIKRLANVNLYNQGLLDQAQQNYKSNEKFIFQILAGASIRVRMTGTCTIQYVLKGGAQGSVSTGIDVHEVINPVFDQFPYTLKGVVDTVVYTQQGFKVQPPWECVAEAPKDSRPQPGDRRRSNPSTGGCVVAKRRGADVDPYDIQQFKIDCGQLVVKILPGWDAYQSRKHTNVDGSKTYTWNMRNPITQDELFPSGDATLGTMANDADVRVTNPGLSYTTGPDGGTPEQLQAFLRQNGKRPFIEFEQIRDGVRDAIRGASGTVFSKFTDKVAEIEGASPFNDNSCVMATSWSRSKCTVELSPF